MKQFKNILLLIVTALLISGCSTSKSVTYTVETGDKIKITLTTSNGYDIDKDVPFTITKNNETVSSGTFVTLDGYNQFVEAVKEDSNATIIDEGSKNGIDYLLYKYTEANTEYNYIIKINNSNTGLIIGNLISQESAKECFNRLTFAKE